MNRTRLRNKYRKSKTASDNKCYKAQRNLCKYLTRRIKKEYFRNLDIKKITDNRTFWKTIAPLFSNKASKGEKINLIENDQIISDNKTISEIFNNFYSDIVGKLNLSIDSKFTSNQNDINDPVQAAIKRFEKHPSILKINEGRHNSKFTFKEK